MKIIYISKYVSLPPYGQETRQIYFARELAKRGHDVEVIASTANHLHTSQPLPGARKVDGFTLNLLPTQSYSKAYGIKRLLSWYSFERRLKRYLQTKEADLVIVSSLSLLSIRNGIRFKQKKKAKLIFEVRDIWPLILSQLASVSKGNLLYKYLERVEKSGYKHADVIVGTMQNLKAHVNAESARQVPVLHIPHCINPNVNYKTSERTEMLDILQSHRQIVCYAGSINRSSALHYFLSCASRFDKKEMAFVLIGEGPEKAKLQAQFQEENVYFLPKVPQAEVLSYLQHASILYDGYTKNSIYKFGSSRNKYVEYCLAKKPILVSYEGAKLFVADSKCGLVVAPESSEAIYSGLRNLLEMTEANLQEMGKNAFTFAEEELQVDKHIDQLLQEANV